MGAQTIDNAAGQGQCVPPRRAVDARLSACSHALKELLQLARQLIAGAAIQLLNLYVPAKQLHF
jgi:hypothetical protein